MKLLGKECQTFPTYDTVIYKIGGFIIHDLPTNSLAIDADQTYFFYKPGDIIPKSYNGFVVVDDIQQFNHSEFKNVISKKGLHLLLNK